MAKDRDPRFVTVVFPVQLSKRPPDTQKKKVFSPGKNTFSPHPYPSATRRFRWPFGKIWSEATALADFFNKYPKYRRFFGYIDVAGHEDEMPNWPLSLALQEFHARLHPWKTKPGEPPSCNIYLSSHQGEQFQTPLQGLRRIWEGIQHLQSQALGHALALKNADFSEESMALEELLDDLVWAWEMLVKYDSPAATLTQRLERRFEEILRNQHLDSTIKIETWEAARKILFSVDKMEKIGILRKEPGAEKKHFYAGYPKQYLPPNSLKGNTERLDSEKCRKFLDFLKSCGLEEDPERLCLERISNSEWSMPYHLKDCREDLRKAYEILVNMVLEEIRKKGVIIQLCPTSNLVIGGLRSYTDHPLFDYDSHDNGLDKGLLTLNTDDPTVFQVSIYDETATMYMAAKRKWPEKSNEQIASWIRDICRVGRESCCPSLRGFTKTGIIAAIDECLQG